MKLRITDVFEGNQSLQELARVKTRIRATYKIARIQEVYNEEMRKFQKAQDILLDKYEAVTDKEKGTRTVPDEHAKEYKKEIQELLDTEIEITVPVLKVEDLKDADGKDLEIPASAMVGLTRLVEGMDQEGIKK